jgi:hypothetical protein
MCYPGRLLGIVHRQRRPGRRGVWMHSVEGESGQKSSVQRGLVLGPGTKEQAIFGRNLDDRQRRLNDLFRWRATREKTRGGAVVVVDGVKRSQVGSWTSALNPECCRPFLIRLENGRQGIRRISYPICYGEQGLSVSKTHRPRLETRCATAFVFCSQPWSTRRRSLRQ